ncbi:hypothetical protein [Desulfovibrio psychrotolerans]|uniref:Uncharacterized protein n=1 Tax=Desulfovibrio psychrotolerans TaxID=415242 RepID=A0A7J0BS94_9BACT|nr:hypothetical protein [Desulfovibrio psychrotolerans]GFM36577.1 hypothetical protein DSM19430T_12610 [Desulfovibrio psychrotolerans]
MILDAGPGGLHGPAGAGRRDVSDAERAAGVLRLAVQAEGRLRSIVDESKPGRMQDAAAAFGNVPRAVLEHSRDPLEQAALVGQVGGSMAFHAERLRMRARDEAHAEIRELREAQYQGFLRDAEGGAADGAADRMAGSAVGSAEEGATGEGYSPAGADGEGRIRGDDTRNRWAAKADEAVRTLLGVVAAARRKGEDPAALLRQGREGNVVDDLVAAYGPEHSAHAPSGVTPDASAFVVGGTGGTPAGVQPGE